LLYIHLVFSPQFDNKLATALCVCVCLGVGAFRVLFLIYNLGGNLMIPLGRQAERFVVNKSDADMD